MNLLETWRNRGAGNNAGDFDPDDLRLDDTGWLIEDSRVHGLVSDPRASNPTGMVQLGRIRWDKVLAGMVAPEKLDYQPGWQGRGAPVMDAEPAAALWHWTGGKPTQKRPCPSLVICRDGGPAGKGVTAVPGPLVHGIIGIDGVLHILASGRANHAGTGHKELLARMRAGEPPLGTARALGLADTGGSGGALVGFEVENDGVQPFTDAQLETCGRLGRALWRLNLGRTRAVGWSHLNWTSRKIDNGTQQARIAAAYDAWQPLR